MTHKFGRKNCVVSFKSILHVTRRVSPNISRRYDYKILKEFEQYGFIERIDKRVYKFHGNMANDLLKKLDDGLPF